MVTMEWLIPCWHFQNRVIFFILHLNVANILVAQFKELAVTPILSFLSDQNPDAREAGVHVLMILSMLGGIFNFLT